MPTNKIVAKILLNDKFPLREFGLGLERMRLGLKFKEKINNLKRKLKRERLGEVAESHWVIRDFPKL